MDPRDPDLLRTKPKARSGQIRLLPVRNVTGDERAHVRNKSSIFDVLNNEFDRAVKFFSNKTWLYEHRKYEPTKFLFFWFFLTSNSTRQLVWISLSLPALKPQSITCQLLRENFIPSSKIFIGSRTTRLPDDSFTTSTWGLLLRATLKMFLAWRCIFAIYLTQIQQTFSNERFEHIRIN